MTKLIANHCAGNVRLVSQISFIRCFRLKESFPISEKFLSMCVDTNEIRETTRYIWVKARVFTRKCLAAFIEQNPSGDLNATIRFIRDQKN